MKMIQRACEKIRDILSVKREGLGGKRITKIIKIVVTCMILSVVIYGSRLNQTGWETVKAQESTPPRMLSSDEVNKLNVMLWQGIDTKNVEKTWHESSVDVGDVLYGLNISENTEQNLAIGGDPNSMAPYMENGQVSYLYSDGTVAYEGFSNSALYQKYGWYVSSSFNERGGFGRVYFNDNSSIGVLEDADVVRIDSVTENGLLRVGAKGKVGYMNTAGEIQIPLAFIAASPFSEGLAKVMVENKDESIDLKYIYTFIDEEGHIHAPFFNEVSDYENGYAAVSFSLDGKLYMGFLNLDGNLEYAFENVQDIDDISYISDDGMICIGGVKFSWETDSKEKKEMLGGYYLFDIEGKLIKEFDVNRRISAFLPCGLALVQDVSAVNNLWETSENLVEYCKSLSSTETKFMYVDVKGNQVGEIWEMTMEEAEQFLWDGFGIYINECSQAQTYVETISQNISQQQGDASEKEMVGRSIGCNLEITDSFIAAIRADGTVVANGKNTYEIKEVADWTGIEAISGEGINIAGLKKDGTVIFTTGQFPNAAVWTNIVDIAMGEYFVAGLTEDGTVLLDISDLIVEGYFEDDGVSEWRNIQDISIGGNVLAGITEDGKVKLFSGLTDISFLVSDWSNIISVAVGKNSSSIIAGLREDGTVVAVDLYESDTEKYSIDSWQDIVAISVGKDHIVGLKSDGSVLCTWPNVNGQCNTEDWSDVAEIAAGDGCTGAIKKDGTLLFTGKGINNSGEVSEWTDVIDIDASDEHSLGVKSDGTVLVAGENPYAEEIRGWSNIASVETSHYVAVGLKEDGTVAATGSYLEEVSEWQDIVSVSASDEIVGVRADGTVLDTGLRGNESISGWYDSDIISTAVSGFHVVGLKTDGTVIATGDNDAGECQVSEWNDVVDVVAAWGYTAGLCSDGTVLFAGKPAWGAFSTQEWTNIQKLYADDYYLVGLKEDGSLVLVGQNSINQEIIKSWDNIVDVAINDNCILGLKRDGTVVAAMNGTSSAAAVREWKDLRVMTDYN